MTSASVGIATRGRLTQRAVVYIRLLKPRETLLLSIIGLCAAVVAGDGSPPLDRFLIGALVIVLGSGGTNGLTNYLDRHVDARMRRTRHRVLPSGLIDPPRLALLWAGFLVAVALGIALAMHPYAFLAGATGVAAALIARKTWATHFLGSFSSCGPVLVGWFVITPDVTWTLVLMATLIVLWLPIHVWNLMIATSDDYLQAGVNIFPLNHGVNTTARLSVGLSILLYATSLALVAAGGFGWVYLVAANVGGMMMVRATWRILKTSDRASAFSAFKASAYPYLGLIFLSLPADIWLRAVV